MQKFNNRFTGNVHTTADRLVNSNPRDEKLGVSDIFQIMFRLVDWLVNRLWNYFQVTSKLLFFFILGIKFLWSCQCIYNKNCKIHVSNMFQHLKLAQQLYIDSWQFHKVLRHTQLSVIYSRLEIVRGENKNTNQNQLCQSWLNYLL